MENYKGLKDRIIEFLMVSATLFTIIILIGIKLEATLIIVVLGVGSSVITVYHITNFFQKMSNNIEEIKNYINAKQHITKEVEKKMGKSGKVRWLVIIWSIIIGLAVFLLLKTLFKL